MSTHLCVLTSDRPLHLWGVLWWTEVVREHWGSVCVCIGGVRWGPNAWPDIHRIPLGWIQGILLPSYCAASRENSTNSTTSPYLKQPYTSWKFVIKLSCMWKWRWVLSGIKFEPRQALVWRTDCWLQKKKKKTHSGCDKDFKQAWTYIFSSCTAVKHSLLQTNSHSHSVSVGTHEKPKFVQVDKRTSF